MEPRFKEVWLNKQLLRLHQDDLGYQGSRVRGNASECQVFSLTFHCLSSASLTAHFLSLTFHCLSLPFLDLSQVWQRFVNNGDMYVLLFNSGKGSCATATGKNATMTVSWEELGIPQVRAKPPPPSSPRAAGAQHTTTHTHAHAHTRTRTPPPRSYTALLAARAKAALVQPRLCSSLCPPILPGLHGSYERAHLRRDHGRAAQQRLGLAPGRGIGCAPDASTLSLPTPCREMRAPPRSGHRHAMAGESWTAWWPLEVSSSVSRNCFITRSLSLLDGKSTHSFNTAGTIAHSIPHTSCRGMLETRHAAVYGHVRRAATADKDNKQKRRRHPSDRNRQMELLKSEKIRTDAPSRFELLAQGTDLELGVQPKIRCAEGHSSD